MSSPVATSRFLCLAGPIAYRLFLLLLLATGVSPAFASAASTTTILVVTGPGGTPASVAAGTVVTLTASAQSGANAITRGQVDFCDATATYCTGSGLLGTAPLTSAGTAILRLRPSIGTHSYKAALVANNAALSSTSTSYTFIVNGTPSDTIIQSGSIGAYELTATVTGLGSTIAPTGAVSFLDTTNSNYLLASASLDGSTLMQSFAPQVAYGAGTLPQSIASGDFNGDGILDLAVANRTDGTISVLLGNSDGTFKSQVVYEAGPYTYNNFPASLTAADLNGDGVLDLVMVNNDNDDSTITVLLGRGDGTFLLKGSYPSASGLPVALCVGDFNQDGILDVAVTDYLGGQVFVLLGAGDGSFPTKTGFTTGDTPQAVAAGDFNGDGSVDLVVTNQDAPINVLLGKGDGTFNPATSLGSSSNLTLIAIADFNHDGIPDLAGASTSATGIQIFLGKGDGTFNAPIATSTSGDPKAIAISDLNGDGVPDLVVAVSGSNAVVTLLGVGDGTFVAQTPQSTGSGPAAITTGDFNGDGIADLATANTTDASVSVLLNILSTSATSTVTGISPVGLSYPPHAFEASYLGDAAYADAVSTTAALTAAPVTTALTFSASSAEGDSVILTATLAPNAAQGHSTDGETITFQNYGNSIGTAKLVSGLASFSPSFASSGTYSLNASYPGDGNFSASSTATTSYIVSPLTSTSLTLTQAGSVQTSIASGSAITLTAAVTSDLATGLNGTVKFCDASGPYCRDSYLLGTAQLTASKTATLTLRPSIGNHNYRAVFVANNTGGASTSATANLVVTGASSTSITQSGAVGAYTLTATVTGAGSTTAPTGTVSFLDTTNSNYILASASLAGTSVVVSFAPQKAYGTGVQPKSVASGDFNGDGVLDLAVANYTDGTISVLLGNSDGTFKSQVVYEAGSYAYDNFPASIATADFNGDGVLDLVVVNNDNDDSTVTVLLGNGDGTFSRKGSYAAGDLPNSLCVGDFNQDGILDLAVTDYLGGRVFVLLGAGDGSFPNQTGFSTSGTPQAVAASDFNGDGFLDLVVTNQDAPTNVLLGNGDGTFKAAASLASSSNLTLVAVADFNRDGVPDLAGGSPGAAGVQIFLGKGDGTFNTPVVTLTAGNPTSMAVSDLNGDGVPDLVVTLLGSNGVTTLLGVGDGTLIAQAAQSTGSGPAAITTGDFNGDGIADLAIANQTGASVSVLLNSLSTSATATVTGISPVGATSSIHAANGTYSGDLIYGSSTSGAALLTASPQSSTLVLSPGVVSSPYGTQITLTATLNPSTAQGHAAAGQVLVSINGTSSLGPASLIAGIAMIQTNQLAGTGTLTATYSADPNFVATSSNSVSYTITPASPSITVSSPKTFVAAYVALNASIAFTGPVAPSLAAFTFAVGTGAQIPAICTGTTSPLACFVSYPIANLTAGSYPITVQEIPDLRYSSSGASGTLTITASAAVATSPSCTLALVQASVAPNANVSSNVQCSEPNQIPQIILSWGDSTAPTSVPNGPITHQYAANTLGETYLVSVTATDSLNQTATVTQSVFVAGTVSPAPGQTKTTVVSAGPTSNPTMVAFVCTSVLSSFNGTPTLPSQYGISCTSSPVTVLPNQTTPVTLSITTTGTTSTTMALRSLGAPLELCTLAFPFTGFGLLSLGALVPGGTCSKRSRLQAMGMLVLVCFLFCSCGGSFTPPASIPTASGLYLLTASEVIVCGQPAVASASCQAPSGFVQTSLIVPLSVGVN